MGFICSESLRRLPCRTQVSVNELSLNAGKIITMCGDEIRKALLANLKALIEIPSPSGEEFEIQKYLFEKFSKAGFECAFSEVERNRPNLIAIRGRNPHLICTHCDTVIADRYEFVLHNEKVFGRGAADAKGQLAALITAVQNTDHPATIAITVDEELEGKGSARLNLPPWIKDILVLEPTGFDICISQAGSIELEISSSTRAYHASCASEKDNPILILNECLKIIQKIRSSEAQKYSLNLPSVTPYSFQAGNHQLFATPEEAIMRLDIALYPQEDPESVLSSILKEIEAKFQNLVSVKVVDKEHGVEMNADSEIVSHLIESFKYTTGKTNQYSMMPSWTDAGNFVRRGYDAIVFGAGDLSFSHTKSEHINISDLIILERFFENLLNVTESCSGR